MPRRSGHCDYGNFRMGAPVKTSSPAVLGFETSPAVRVAAGIFLLAVLLRLLALNGLSGTAYFLPVDGDTAFYHGWAWRILGGQWTDGRAFYGLPGYAYFLAALYAVTGADPFVIGLLQAVLDSGTCLIIFSFARWMTRRSRNDEAERAGGLWVAGLAALGWAFFLPAQAFSIVLMPTSLLVFAYWGGLFWIAACRSRSLWRPWLAIGVGIGMVAMTVATVFFLIPAAFFAILRNQWCENGRWSRSAVAFLSLVAGVVIGVSPAWLHNVLAAGENVTLSAHSGINFYVGNNPEATGYPKMPLGMRAGQAEMMADSLSFAEKAEGRPLKRSEVSRFWSERAHEFIRAHPGRWLGLMGIKFRNFWSSYQYDDLSLIATLRSDGLLLPGLKFGLVAVLGLSGAFFTVRRWPRAGWAAAGTGLHLLAILPVFITERYRLAAVPGLLILGGGGLAVLADALREKRVRRMAAYAGGTAAAFLFVTWPQQDEQLWSLDLYNVGIKATEAAEAAGDAQARTQLLDEAEASLMRAYRYVPENAEISFALGNVMLARTRIFEAKMWYRQALGLDPRHARALNNLGVLALREKRWPTAQKLFEKSLEQQPADAKTNYLLALAAWESGDPATARRALGRALSARPDQAEFLELRDRIEKK